MITPIKLHYLGESEKRGGRQEIVKTIEVSCFWEPNMSRYWKNDRIMSKNPSAVVDIMFDPSVDEITVENCEIEYNGENYNIVDVSKPPASLGLDNNYTLVVTQK